MIYELHVRRGRLINTDPQRRCYNGCYFSAHMEWSDWKHWMDCSTEEQAELNKRLFQRKDQEFKIVAKEPV